MNWLLPSLVLGLASVLLLSDIQLARRLSRMNDEERRRTWGGLQGHIFYLWAVTFLLSSFGCCSSFVLYVSRGSLDGVSTCAFAGMNASCLALNYGLERERKGAVLACLCTNVLICMWLFVYAWVVLQADSALILATHLCNGVGIFHAAIMDLILWHEGWLIQLESSGPGAGTGDTRVFVLPTRAGSFTQSPALLRADEGWLIRPASCASSC